MNPRKQNLERLRFMVRVVSESHGVTLEEFHGPHRPEMFVLPRHLVSWLARSLTTITFAEIANELGHDHQTIIHGVRRTEERINTDGVFASRAKRWEATFAELFQVTPNRRPVRAELADPPALEELRAMAAKTNKTD